MKIPFSIFIIFTFFSCNSKKSQSPFDCYSEALNLLHSKDFSDTIYVATNFPDFKVSEGKFPEEIFDYNDLIQNQNDYLEIIPDNKFWHFHLLNNVKPAINRKNKKNVHFTRFKYSVHLKLEEYPNFNRTYITFSPIYYDKTNNNGFFIGSEINNIKIGSSTVFFVRNDKGLFTLYDHVSIHRFMPY